MRVVPAAGRHRRGCTAAGRSTLCEDILRGQPQRQPRLASTECSRTNSRSTPCVDGLSLQRSVPTPAAGPDSARGCDCRPAAVTTSRSTPCVDALREEPRRQPRLAATGSKVYATKRRRPAGAVLIRIELKARIRRPARPRSVPAGGTPKPLRSVCQLGSAARVRRRWLLPPARHSAVWPDPSALRSG